MIFFSFVFRIFLMLNLSFFSFEILMCFDRATFINIYIFTYLQKLKDQVASVLLHS